ncbi:ventricular zone-expressed PH domain-containing protein 1-like isoform X2 [Ptychodera flava]|uniref:ventricular zone-expressed PH domain-containing protein 1-like isoform X2 n=1 Tax=Ptychodera flava TaxID=63121 RepID=UPI00396A2CE9
MHTLFMQVLTQRDLARAGDLFSIEDKDIVDDLSDVLRKIQEISSSKDYLKNDNDQSVVEICITRVTTAIRETGSIEKHAAALVSLWQCCLEHNLKPSNKDEDPPHAKIASDIMSCLFMNYSRKSVMELAVPVAVKFLQQGNKEITRNMSSYLSLVAIESGCLLAMHTNPIIDSIIEGNRSLTRVLPQIYAEEPKPINEHVSDLVLLLPECDSSEKNNILQLIGLVAKQDAKLLESHVCTLAEHLKNSSTSQAVLTAFVDMASTSASPLACCLPALKEAARSQAALMSLAAKIFGAVGRLNKAYGKECIAFLVSQLPAVDHTTLPAVLIEIKSIGDQYPSLLGIHLSAISKQGESSSTAARMIVQQLQEDIAKCGPILDMFDLAELESPTTSEAMSQTENIDLTTQSEAKDAETEVGTDANKSESSTLKSAHSTTSLKKSQELKPVSASDEKSTSTNAVATVNNQSSHSAMKSSSNELQENDTASKLSNSNTDTANKASIHSLSKSDERSVPNESPSNSNRETLTRDSNRDEKHTTATLRMDGLQASGQKKNRDSSIQQYLAHRHKEITSYMDSVRPRIPIPYVCIVEGYASRSIGRLEFYCSRKGSHCLFNKTPFVITTRTLQPWVHLMFLELQASSSTPVSLDDDAVQNLKACWEQQKKGGPIPFTRLITQPFPVIKIQDHLIDELTDVSYFDVFCFNKDTTSWLCFLCNNPDKATGLLHEGQPMIEGCLKEKKVRWRLFKRWKTRYFTLAGEQLVGSKSKSQAELDQVNDTLFLKHLFCMSLYSF